jgi:tRNA pseudouridine38-40 synthase
MPRIRLDIAYDGTGFNGWAKQPNQRTVQGVLEAALETVLRAPARLVVAGRTDAGVHAVGQVAHVDLDEAQLASLSRRKVPIPELVATRLNGVAGLKSDVVVRRSSVAPDGFDARFSPVWRRYRYRIADQSAIRDPLRRLDTLWYPADLDITAMHSAAQELLGLHDWAAYCRPRVGATTIRDLLDFRWQRDADGVLVAELKADAFCHSMVRALVGAAVTVGEGKLPGDRLTGIRDAAQRTNDFRTMPGHGLTLVEVGYPPDDQLAARAEQTRARRDAE